MLIALLREGGRVSIGRRGHLQVRSRPTIWSASPWGKIPALDHDGFQLYETDAITRYIDEASPGMPATGTPHPRARMMQAIGIVDSYAYKPMVVDCSSSAPPCPRWDRAPTRSRSRPPCRWPRRRSTPLFSVKGEGPWMAGDSFSLADLHLAPVVAYRGTDPGGRAMLQRRPAIGHGGEKEASKRPSVVATRSPLEVIIGGRGVLSG